MAVVHFHGFLQAVPRPKGSPTRKCDRPHDNTYGELVIATSRYHLYPRWYFQGIVMIYRMPAYSVFHQSGGPFERLIIFLALIVFCPYCPHRRRAPHRKTTPLI